MSSVKWVESVFEGHSLVSGVEGESNRRNEQSTSLQNGVPILTDEFGDSLTASALRFAAYVQDEWDLTPHWSAQS